jgi:hypothetical protein
MLHGVTTQKTVNFTLLFVRREVPIWNPEPEQSRSSHSVLPLHAVVYIPSFQLFVYC